jgi:PD-(D/E)XK nuclease superfamily protein
MDEENLRRLLQEMKKFDRLDREKNIFSIGARGYYENPTSDLFSFFLDPTGDHMLGDLVLSCLLECLPDSKPFPVLDDAPEREYITEAGNRIDILLNGHDWVLVIENKLEHSPANPFEEYKASIEQNEHFLGKHKYFVILAPYNPYVSGWAWISYRCLLDKVRKRLGERFVTSGFSKWGMFLREFLLNIEAQVGRDMNENEFNFIQGNYADISFLLALHEDYMNRLSEIVRRASEEVLGVNPVNVKRHNWKSDGIALRVYLKQGRQDNATLLVCPDGKFRIQFYVQANARNEGIDRLAFIDQGNFADWGNEANGSLWLFAKDEESLNSALRTLKTALTLLIKNTQ